MKRTLLFSSTQQWCTIKRPPYPHGQFPCCAPHSSYRQLVLNFTFDTVESSSGLGGRGLFRANNSRKEPMVRTLCPDRDRSVRRVLAVLNVPSCVSSTRNRKYLRLRNVFEWSSGGETKGEKVSNTSRNLSIAFERVRKSSFELMPCTLLSII